MEHSNAFTNRPLILKMSSIRKMPSRWNKDSESALLEIWAEKMGELRGCRKNSHIILKMVEQLEEQGYKYSVLELKTKIHNLTARYRREKKIETTGGPPSEWELFKDMDLLLSSHKSFSPENHLEDSMNSINSSIAYSEQPDVSQSFMPNVSSPTSVSNSVSPLLIPLGSQSPSTPAELPSPTASSSNAIRKGENIEKICKNIETITKNIKNTTERMVAVEGEKKEVLQNYVEREFKVQEALIEFLKRH